MTCHDARDLFSALVDDALAMAERGELDAHLAGCAECRRELQRFRSTVALLRGIEPARAPAGFVDRVLAAARPVPWYRRFLRVVFLPWPVKLPLEAAALVLVGVTVALVFRGAPELQQAARLETRPPAVSEAPPQPAAEPRPGEPTAPEPRPAAPAPEPEAPRLAAPALEKKAPAVADTRDAAKSRDAPGKREERETTSGDETKALRRQDAEAPSAGQVRPGAKEGAASDVAAQRLSAARVTPAASDVTGRLAVADREAALRALADLVARAGGREVARHALPDGLALDLAIPRAGWPEFAHELARLGRLTVESQAAELPDQVRVSLRVTD